MNKSELIATMAAKAGMTQVEAKKAYEAFVETIHEDLMAGDQVSLIGFGTFSVNERPAHEGYNPIAKKKIQVPAKKSIKFKAGKGMQL